MLSARKPKISVIIPVYNVKPFLEEAVGSVRNQTYDNIEIILVDDGSTDGSGKMCDDLSKQDTRIHVIHQQNRGLSAARNSGLDACTGELIAFLDSDDAFDQGMLSEMERLLSDNDAGIAECNYVIFPGDGKMDSKYKLRKRFANNREGVYDAAEALRMRIDARISTAVWNKLYRRFIWDGLRFPEGHNYEDFEMILPTLERAGRVALTDQTLVIYRLRDGSITKTQTFENTRDHAIAYRHTTEYIREHVPEVFSKDELQAVLEKRYRFLISSFLSCNYGGVTEPGKCKEFIREEIDDTEKLINRKKCSRKIRIAAWGVHYVPEALIKPAHHCYKKLSKTLGKAKKKRKVTSIRLKSLCRKGELPYYCPCCDTYISGFVDGGFDRRPDTFNPSRYEGMDQEVVCPVCRALPRHRILVSWLAENLSSMNHGSVLHFAQERSVRRWMDRNHIACQTADYYQKADLKVNIEDTGLPSDTYDLIICNHVLEHVPDYRKAIKELYRITKPGGSVILSFPVDTALATVDEDEAVKTPEERLARFGQTDHLRVFGRDSEAMLGTFGFAEVNAIRGEKYDSSIKPITGPADYDYNVLWRLTK